MSLVREALAKAERDSAARAAREHGLPAALADSASPFRARHRRRWPWAAGLAAAALAGAAAAALLLDRRPATAARSSAPQRATAPAAPSATVLSSPDPAPKAVAAPRPPAPDTAAPESSAAAPPVTAPAPGRPTRFVRELPLGGGRAVLLGGIAWSEHAPLAYLNGRLVGVGEHVEGLRVKRIGRDLVVLEDGGREVVVALR